MLRLGGADLEAGQPANNNLCSARRTAPASASDGPPDTSGGELLSNQEAVISQALSELPEAAGQHILEAATRNGDVAVRLHQHLEGMFHGNTAESTDGKQRAWNHYCLYMFGQKVPPLDEVPWPPTESEWIAFVMHVRSIVASFLRMQNVVAHVCDMGSRHFGSRAAAAHKSPAHFDPRCIYKQAHKRTVGILLREYGSDLRQVEGITMQEAMNAHKFVDGNSVKGLLMGAAFHVGTTHGGRRPRTLTAMRVKDLTFTAQ